MLSICISSVALAVPILSDDDTKRSNVDTNGELHGIYFGDEVLADVHIDSVIEQPGRLREVADVSRLITEALHALPDSDTAEDLNGCERHGLLAR